VFGGGRRHVGFPVLEEDLGGGRVSTKPVIGVFLFFFRADFWVGLGAGLGLILRWFGFGRCGVVRVPFGRVGGRWMFGLTGVSVREIGSRGGYSSRHG
jgi:hypothetical protein